MKKQTQDTNQFGLTLFVNPSTAVSDAVAQASTFTPRYMVQRDDDNKVIKDGDGKAVLELDEQGNKICTSVTWKMLPRTSEDGPSLQKVSGGKEGQELMKFVAQVEHEAGLAAIARLTQALADGTHTFGGFKQNASGVMLPRFKPTKGVSKQVVVMTDAALIAEAARRGLIKDKAPKAPKNTAPKA